MKRGINSLFFSLKKKERKINMYKRIGKKVLKELYKNENFVEFKDKINDEADEDVKYYQKIYKFKIGEGVHATWKNEADAFKHTFSSAWLSLKYDNTYLNYIYPVKSLLI